MRNFIDSLNFFRIQRCAIASAIFCASATQALGATGVALPGWVCAHPDAIFASAFDAVDNAVPHLSSAGSGGGYPGNQTRSVNVTGYGTHTYYVHVPNGYAPNHAAPLLVALEGAAGSPTLADSQAKTIRSDWLGLANSQGFLVAVPVAGGAQGGWIEPALDGSGPSDYDVIAAVITDMQNAYNVENSRVYGWGFSAGGEVLHDIILTGWVGLDADSFAGYAVTGAVLAGCPTYNAVQSCVAANAARIIPLDIHIGSNDPYIPLSYAQSDRAAFIAAGWTLGSSLFYTEFTDGSPSGGHTFTTAHLSTDWTNLCPNAVIP